MRPCPRGGGGPESKNTVRSVSNCISCKIQPNGEFEEGNLTRDPNAMPKNPNANRQNIDFVQKYFICAFGENAPQNDEYVYRGAEKGNSPPTIAMLNSSTKREKPPKTPKP